MHSYLFLRNLFQNLITIVYGCYQRSMLNFNHKKGLFLKISKKLFILRQIQRVKSTLSS